MKKQAKKLQLSKKVVVVLGKNSQQHLNGGAPTLPTEMSCPTYCKHCNTQVSCGPCPTVEPQC